MPDRVEVVAFVVCPAEKFVSELVNVAGWDVVDEEEVDEIGIPPTFC